MKEDVTMLEQIESLADFARDQGIIQPKMHITITEKAYSKLVEEVGHEVDIVRGFRLKIVEYV